MPEWIGELAGLRTLDLGHNALETVPDLAALSALQILYLHDNALTELPALPPSLTYLNVSENPLPGLSPPALARLIELRALDLGLESLCLPSLPVLRELHLRRNRLTSVPDVRHLRELRLLDLRANRIARAPDWLADLPRLEKLDLRWNEVYDAPAGLRERGCVVLLE